MSEVAPQFLRPRWALRFQLGVPVEVVEPALVQIIGWEQPAVAVQFKHRRPVGHLPRLHAGMLGQVPTLAEVAGRAGRYDVVPAGLAAARAWDQVIESEIIFRPAVLAEESVAQEHVEPGECRIERRLHVCFERHDRGQPHFEGGAADEAIVLRDDIDSVEEYGLHRFLPAPQRQGIVAQRPEVGVQD